MTEQEIVGLYDADYTQLFPTSEAMRASIFETSRSFEHPLESGISITDARVIDPVEIDLIVMIPGNDAKDVYAAIKQRWISGDKLIVQTRSDVYQDMIIVSMPHEEEPELWKTIKIVINLKQAIFVKAQFQQLAANNVRKPTDQSTVKRGEQSGSESILHRIFY